MNIPLLLVSYFEASNNNDTEKQVACFENSAIVFDENETFKGLDEIKKWIINSHSKYNFSSKVIKVEEIKPKFRVTATVSGNFPGSPINLKYDFTIINEKIKNLEIGV